MQLSRAGAHVPDWGRRLHEDSRAQPRAISRCAIRFIWAQQLWNLTASSDDYFQFYLDKYILPDGNFLYNVQDQTEGPLNVGLFLANSARGYFLPARACGI